MAADATGAASPAAPTRQARRTESPAPVPKPQDPVPPSSGQGNSQSSGAAGGGGLSAGAAVVLVASLLSCRAGQAITLSLCRQEGSDHGYPFVAETLLFFPFIAQCVFYFGSLVQQKDMQNAKQQMLDAIPLLGPCLIYSLGTGSGPIWANLAQGYLDGSSVIIIQQTGLLFIAFFEALILKVYPTVTLIVIILWQVAQVVIFKSMDMTSEATPQAAGKGDSGTATGIFFCILAVLCSACGNVLQQRYLQTQAMSVPLNAKLFWQHLISFGVVLFTLAVKIAFGMDNTNQLFTQGFFGGWTFWTYAHTLVTWGSYFLGTAVVAQVGAMASTMVQAVSIVVIGLFEYLLQLRDPFDEIQWFLMFGICINALVFADAKSKVKTD